MNALLADIRFGARTLVRQPGITTVALLTLAIGIGATTTIFSFVNAVLLKPLPYPESGRLVVVAPLPAKASTPIAVSPGDFLDWQAQAHSFDEMGAFTISPSNLTDESDPVRLYAASVTRRLLEVVNVRPEVGTTLADPSGADGGSVLISDRLWRQRFASDAAVVGRTIHLDGDAYTISGVMPPGFNFPSNAMRSVSMRSMPDVDLWIPITLRAGYRSNAFLQVVARLKRGVTAEQARAEMSAIEAGLAEQFPENRGAAMLVTPLQEQMVRGVRPLLLTLFGAVALLLVIACANVANLLLARAAGREREAAIRGALGAGVRRLVQLHLMESLVLGLAGGGAGLLAAVWGLDLVTALIPRGALPRLGEVQLDRQVLIFSTALSVVTGVLFGLAPAWYAVRTDLVEALKGASTTHSIHARPLGALVVAQVALAFVLVTGSGLLLESFWRLTRVDPGFRADRVLAIDVTLPGASYNGLPEMRRFAATAVERLAATPGVDRVGAVNLLPIAGAMLSGDFTVEGATRPPGYVAVKPSVTPGYFAAMAMPIVGGRDFDARDTPDAPLVAIVTESFARRMWPGQNAIGRRLKLGFGPIDQQPWLSVVGVVGDIKQSALADATRPAIYSPMAQAPRPFLLREMSFAVRAAGDPMTIAASVRARIHEIDPALPIGRMASMTRLLSDSVAEPRFRTVLLAGFAMSAVVLITIGMLGVLGYIVTRRTREIGVRMALGAHHVDVVGLVVRQALALTAAGIVVGAALAYPMSGLLAKFLFELSPHDPAAFIGAAIVLGVLAILASYLPARRAVAVDPLVALRSE